MPDKFGDKIRLQHILDAIETIKEYASEVSLEEFSENDMMQDACVRQLQIVGEACSKVSPELRQQQPDIPWRQIIGLRIIVVHQYFGVDEKIIWDVIKNDLSKLEKQIKKVIEGLP